MGETSPTSEASSLMGETSLTSESSSHSLVKHSLAECDECVEDPSHGAYQRRLAQAQLMREYDRGADNAHRRRLDRSPGCHWQPP
jgi:hypothetical protein